MLLPGPELENILVDNYRNLIKYQFNIVILEVVQIVEEYDDP